MNDEELPSWLQDYAASARSAPEVAASPEGTAEPQGSIVPERESTPTLPRPAFLLHPVAGVFWAAFLGSFVAGGVVIALNFVRLGERRRAWIAFGTGLLATVALITLLALLPDNFKVPSGWIAFPQGAIAASLASQYQGVRILDHMRRGGRVASGWRGVGMGLLCALILAGPMIGAVWYHSSVVGERHRFGGDSVFVLAGATPSDAARLAKGLQAIRYFRGEGGEVQLRRDDERWTITFILVDGTAQETEVVERYENAGHYLAAMTLSYPLSIQLCDSGLNVVRTLTFDASPYGQVDVVEGDRVYFSDGVTSAEARKLAHTLKRMGWFGGGGIAVRLRRTDQGYLVSFDVEEATENTPERAKEFHEVGVYLAESGFGYPLTIELCGRRFVPWKTITVDSAPLEPPLPKTFTL